MVLPDSGIFLYFVLFIIVAGLLFWNEWRRG